MEILAIWPWVLLVAAAVIGLLVGSFLNVVAFRVPVMMELSWREQLAELESQPFTPPPAAEGKSFNLWWPPSACQSCGAAISPMHNIPVLGWLMLRGRCAHCEQRVSVRYPIVEGVVALLSLIVAWALGPTPQTLAALLFTWTLIALSLIDLDHKLLPDSMTLPLLWGGLLLSLFSVDGGPVFASLRDSVVGAAAGYLSLWSVYWLFKLLTGKEGMGYGDFKLLGAIGAWLGWQLLPLVILLSAGVGAVVGIAMVLFGGQSRQTAIPFGPYLAAAGWIAMLWGQTLVDWYLGLMF